MQFCLQNLFVQFPRERESRDQTIVVHVANTKIAWYNAEYDEAIDM